MLGQHLADRADAAVHHVARRDGVRPGLDVAGGRADEQLERSRRSTTSPSRSTPQWPWLVYSQRQTSVTSTRSGCSRLSARSACWTIPSSSQAPVASSSFSSGMPKRSTAPTPARTRSAALGDEAVHGVPCHRRAARRSAAPPARRRAASRNRRGRAASRARASAARRCAAACEAWSPGRRSRVEAYCQARARQPPLTTRGGGGRSWPSTSSGSGSCSSSAHDSSSTRSEKNSHTARPAAIVGSASSTPGRP